MIVGCDHLGIGVSDIESGIDAGSTSLGFTCDFREMDLPNHPNKKRYMASWRDDHDIAFLRPPGGGPSLELVHHSDGVTAGTTHRTALVINGPLTGLVPQTATPWSSDDSLGQVSEAFGGHGAVAGSLPGDLGTAIVIEPGDGSAAAAGEVLGAAIRVSDLERSVAYWCEALGFRVVEGDDAQPGGRASLTLSSPVPSWALRVALVQSPEVDRSPGFLDALGMTNICLLSTDAETDARRMNEFPGASMEPPFRIQVSERRLRVAVGHGPSGENIELIEIERGDRSRNA